MKCLNINNEGEVVVPISDDTTICGCMGDACGRRDGIGGHAIIQNNDIRGRICSGCVVSPGSKEQLNGIIYITNQLILSH